jgi:hypothetical protein
VAADFAQYTRRDAASRDRRHFRRRDKDRLARVSKKSKDGLTANGVANADTVAAIKHALAPRLP